MKKKIVKCFAKWLDVIFLLPGMTLISMGVFQIFRPAGFITAGLCFIALAFFIASKQAGESA